MINQITCGMTGEQVRTILNECITWINSHNGLSAQIEQNNTNIQNLQRTSASANTPFVKQYTGSLPSGTIAASTHAKGANLIVQVWDGNGNLINCSIQNSNGNVTWQSDTAVYNPKVVIAGVNV